MLPPVTLRSCPRLGRWLVVGLTGIILAAMPAANAFASTSGSDEAAAEPNPVQPLPLSCDKLSPLPRCLSPAPTSTVRCHDWTVEKVRAVGGGPHLLVSAVCLARGGERLQLRRHDPQGINPANLLLELVVYRSPFPDGPASREERIIDVEPDAGYTSVTILPDGPTLPINRSA
jgi:hypothetical protein